MSIRSHIEGIEAAAGDPRRGLPEEIFLLVSRLTPLINVDLLIQDDDARTLLTWRDDEYFGAGWHLPGSIIRYKEFAVDRVRVCAREELGASVECDAVPLLVAEAIDAAQRTRAHAISLLYRCHLTSSLDERRKAGAGPLVAGQWRWHDRCPPDLIASQQQYARFF
jgi:colanic acid biosynthesis protein WcaH